ncbi:hypothetical protein [Thetidibacter halocola]|uniref:Cyanovirin-N domain-containing protein n=1 Tax=Thetidibacter halocola TaxID=2827239 RepID=A0A8J7WEZ8_9RHOB|nr:hypothetical protein [Thetidibacter halocola]MBS0124491.1 hypothetical protein [Thetidibacter halocola]
MKLVKALCAGFLFSLSLAVSAADAQDARVVVPDAPKGALISGCYRADRPLYGPYQLTFCVNRGRRGTYSVRGPQLACEGRLGWALANGMIVLELRRQSCNNNRAWAAAEIRCKPRGLLSVILDDLIRDLTRGGGDRGRVVVPDRPTIGRLTCTYYPTVPGIGNRQFLANRSLVEPR